MENMIFHEKYYGKKLQTLSFLFYKMNINIMIRQKYSFNNSSIKSFFFNKWEMNGKKIINYKICKQNKHNFIMKLVYFYKK